MADNQITKICAECGCEFKISKFQPYIIWCKEHRKGKQDVIKNTTSKKSKKKAKQEMKSHGFNCPQCESIKDQTNMGMFICPNKNCNTHYWVYGNGWYRTFHPPYKMYFEGEFRGEVGDTDQPTMAEVMRNYNGPK